MEEIYNQQQPEDITNLKKKTEIKHCIKRRGTKINPIIIKHLGSVPEIL
jgi:hypothetical protein